MERLVRFRCVLTRDKNFVKISTIRVPNLANMIIALEKTTRFSVPSTDDESEIYFALSQIQISSKDLEEHVWKIHGKRKALKDHSDETERSYFTIGIDKLVSIINQEMPKLKDELYDWLVRRMGDRNHYQRYAFPIIMKYTISNYILNEKEVTMIIRKNKNGESTIDGSVSLFLLTAYPYTIEEETYW